MLSQRRYIAETPAAPGNWSKGLERLFASIEEGQLSGCNLIALPDDPKEQRKALIEIESAIAEKRGASIETCPLPKASEWERERWTGISELHNAYWIMDGRFGNHTDHLKIGKERLLEMLRGSRMTDSVERVEREWDQFDKALFFRLLGDPSCVLLKPTLDTSSPKAYAASVMSLFKAIDRYDNKTFELRDGLLTGEQYNKQGLSVGPMYTPLLAVTIPENLIEPTREALRFDPDLARLV